MYRLPAVKLHRCSRTPWAEATCPGCTEFSFPKDRSLGRFPVVLIHATGSVAKYGQVYRTDAGAPSRLFWSHQNSAAVPRPSHHPVSAPALLALHQLRQGAPDACRGGEWTGERLSTRVGEMGRNEFTELGIQGAALYGEVLSPWAWCCMMRSAPRPRRLQGQRSAMGIWPRFLFPLVPNSLAWCCTETGFPPRAPGPPAHPAVLTAP